MRIPAVSVCLPPLLLRLQHDGGFHHAHRRGIGGGLGLADLCRTHFGPRETAQQLVLDLKVLRGFGYGDSRQRDRHVQDRAFVQRRHEFRSELQIDGNRQGDKQERSGNHQPLVIQDEPDDGMVHAHERTADRMIFFTVDFATKNGVGHSCQPSRAERERLSAHKQEPQRGVQRDGKNGCNGH